MWGKDKKDQAEKMADKKRAVLITAVVVLFQLLAGAILFLLPALIRRGRPAFRKRAKQLQKGEKKEVKELVTGKESFSRFCGDSLKLVKDFFIPSASNNHRPKSLRPKSLLVYLAIALLIKTVATGALFLVYPSPAEMTAVIASKMIELTNASRLEAGVAALQIDPVLTAAAQRKGQDMMRRSYFSHDAPDGLKPWQWIDRADYDYIYAGENLAMDFTSAEAIQAAFMKSPSHQKNILNPKYQDIGVAVVSGEMAGRPTDLLVVFFGTRRSALAGAQIASTVVKPIAKAKEETVESWEKNQITNSKLQIISNDQNSKFKTEEIQPAAMPTESVASEVLNQTSEGVIVVSAENLSGRGLADLIIEYSNIVFAAFIIFVGIALLLNIFIKIRVQHAPLILQSLAVLALISAMVLVKFHFAEKIAPQMMILG